MAGLVPAIHVFLLKTWMAGTRPGMTNLNQQPRTVMALNHKRPNRARRLA